MNVRVCLGLAVAVLLSPLAVSPAQAWFKFTNKTSKPVFVAFVRYSPGCEGGVPWEKKGWWKLAPGETKTVQGDAISNRYSYYYAESDDRSLLWTSGGPGTCLPQPAFTWCWNTCNNSPTTRTLNLRKVDTGSNANYTLNLTPPGGASAPAAPGGEAAIEGRSEPAGRSAEEIPAAGAGAAATEAATESRDGSADRPAVELPAAATPTGGGSDPARPPGYDLADDIKTVSLHVSRHPTVALTDVDADRILADMGTVLQMKDQPNDTPTRVRFVRNGPVRVLPTTVAGVIQTQDQFNALMAAGTGVKVVRDIRWCGGPGGSIIGCAPIGVSTANLSVVRFTANQEGILWAHEYGHNCGLNHRTDDANAVMNPVIAPNRRVVSAAESTRYLGGPAGLMAAEGAVHGVPAPMPGGHQPEKPIAPKDVREFVRQHYFDGVPYEAAATYTEKDAEILLGMLADAGKHEEFLPEIITTLCYIGSDKAVEPIIGFVNGPLDSKPAYKAKHAALIHLGNLIHKTKNKAALEYLTNMAAKPAWVAKVAGVRLPKALEAARADGVTAPTAEELAEELAVSAVQGLGQAGTKEAEDALKGLKNDAGVPALAAQVAPEALKTNDAIRTKGLAEYIKSIKHK